MARQDVRTTASPASADHLRNQCPVYAGGGHPLSAGWDRLRRMSIIEEGEEIRSHGPLAIVGSCSVNGVAKLHTELLERTVLEGFRGILAGEIQQQNQRHHAAALAA